MSKEKENELDPTFKLIKEGESTESFMCKECECESYKKLDNTDPSYAKGFRYQCTGCGVLMKDLKHFNVFSKGYWLQRAQLNFIQKSSFLSKKT